ncbi:exopolysaccharide biosynthesis polyprenyl glycosylphosphotransferase [Agromyces terreus]|uniref:Exopolysaccharide biosynthesis polyprenyl glycosylphosphotransferase n=1 Tax=Agromyces terreus TaxID=424795 RepID=A0A9X2GVP6_9MICO|nr:sugar transferase [Agromyces terreus]MCP2369472.1 exopolysaccharide biosynthesis polyprenyl glycosylphosphotransferase [Agromyces terreus]
MVMGRFYAAATMSTTAWSAKLAARVRVTDLLVLLWVVFGTQIAWVGLDTSARGFSGSRGDIAISYTVVSLVIVASWMLALELFDTRSPRVLGLGSQEYRAVADSAVRLFGLVAIVAFLFKIDVGRGYILIAFPLGVLVLIFSRWMWRQWLGVMRQRGEYSSRVLLVGSEASVTVIARELERMPQAGYRVAGACLPGHGEPYLPGTHIPVEYGMQHALAVMRDFGADTVIITSSDELGPERVRELSWGLIPGAEHLVVAPSLIDIGGPRIHTRPVAGLPLMHVETPKFEGRKLVAKRVFDLIVGFGLVVVLSPLFVVLAVLVKASSPGPVFYRQERVGLKGKPFTMLKFRSMSDGADAQLAGLLAANGTDTAPLFKVQDDPRVTRIGRVLRKYSLDELPQLFNVLHGTMSLVGPRPQRRAEVALYEGAAGRRLFVQPGMTGLWQVSGRSTLSWEQSVRLDLYYVENWSVTGDFVLLWRTFRAVLAPGEEAK